jgi:hypothetical protein
MRSTQWQLGTWEPAQHLLENRGEPKKKKKLSKPVWIFEMQIMRTVDFDNPKLLTTLKRSNRTSKVVHCTSVAKVN